MMTCVCGLLVDERALQLRGLRARTQALERGDRTLELADRKQARAHRLAVQVHGARAALAQAAAKARALQREVLAQHVEQGRIGFDVDRAVTAVDLQGVLGHRTSSVFFRRSYSRCRGAAALFSRKDLTS